MPLDASPLVALLFLTVEVSVETLGTSAGEIRLDADHVALALGMPLEMPTLARCHARLLFPCRYGHLFQANRCVCDLFPGVEKRRQADAIWTIN